MTGTALTLKAPYPQGRGRASDCSGAPNLKSADFRKRFLVEASFEAGKRVSISRFASFEACSRRWCVTIPEGFLIAKAVSAQPVIEYPADNIWRPGALDRIFLQKPRPHEVGRIATYAHLCSRSFR